MPLLDDSNEAGHCGSDPTGLDGYGYGGGLGDGLGDEYGACWPDGRGGYQGLIPYDVGFCEGMGDGCGDGSGSRSGSGSGFGYGSGEGYYDEAWPTNIQRF